MALPAQHNQLPGKAKTHPAEAVDKTLLPVSDALTEKQVKTPNHQTLGQTSTLAESFDCFGQIATALSDLLFESGMSAGGMHHTTP